MTTLKGKLILFIIEMSLLSGCLWLFFKSIVLPPMGFWQDWSFRALMAFVFGHTIEKALGFADAHRIQREIMEYDKTVIEPANASVSKLLTTLTNIVLKEYKK